MKIVREVATLDSPRTARKLERVMILSGITVLTTELCIGPVEIVVGISHLLLYFILKMYIRYFHVSTIPGKLAYYILLYRR